MYGRWLTTLALAAVASFALLTSACTSGGSGSDDGSFAFDSGFSDSAVLRRDAGRVPVPDGCVAAPESCNGADDDCDGFVDDGTGDAVGCGTGEICVAGACGCPADAICGGECVDIEADPDNCGACGERCLAGQVCGVVGCCDAGSDRVDLLFMIDNSNSMAEEQASLAAAFPQLITALTSGDAGGDGVADFPPVTDLQVGVITADMGTGGHDVATCSRSALGDDGVLRTNGDSGVAGCAASYPSFLSWIAGGDQRAFARSFSCVAAVGTGGCAFEQQLEAVLKAITPSAAPITFSMGTTGHADGANVRFLRDGAVLGLVLVTDEEDCSAADDGLFDPASTRYRQNLNLRCFSNPGALHPIRRYVDGFIDARGRSGDIVFTAIVGVPTDLAGQDPTTILADPRMAERLDPETPNSLVPSCNIPGRGLAFPPRRIVGVGRDLEAAGVVTTIESICQSDFTPAIRAVAERVGMVIGRSCGPD